MCHLADGLLLATLGLAIIGLGWGQAEVVAKSEEELRKASACYSNYNNFMRLHCGPDEEIEIREVIYGVKVIDSDCISPATKKTYKKRCCTPGPDDCTFDASVASVGHRCNGFINCEIPAEWSLTAKDCDQEEYKQYTNYMQTTYICKPASVFIDKGLPIISSSSSTSLSTSNTSETISTRRSSTPEPSAFLNISTSARSETETDLGHAIGVPDYNRFEEDETIYDESDMSNSMIGAIVGGSLGMLFTFVVFVFYWSRKRRLRIITKPEPSVWDYLLSQTFTVRGSRGYQYDHFSNARSSASSEASISPVIRKNLWLPNISPEDDVRSDVTSNYDNDKPLVEIHQSASPQPYAFVSLGVHQNNLDRHNLEA